MAEVDAVIGNDDKLQAQRWARLGADLGADPHAGPNADVPKPVHVTDIFTVRATAPHLAEGLQGRARAFVEVQQGCDHRCTFCIIPYGRGNARSVPIGAVVERVRGLVAQGYAEVVLTGVDVTSWGGDLPGRPKLGQLCRRLLAQVPELPRLRLSSVDPAEIDDDIWRLIADEPRLMPHLHLSVQAGDDMILKRMKRRHLRADVLDVTRRARALRPDILFGADIIAGFPTETAAMAANTLALVEEADLTFLHVFPYSPREGTPAARMPQVPKPEIKARAAALRAAGVGRLQAALAAHRPGELREVLVERPEEARLPSFLPVRLARPGPEGRLVHARLTGHDGTHLLADPA